MPALRLRHRCLELLALLASGALLAFRAEAGEVRVIEPSETLDAKEITRIFARPASEARPRTRSIRKVAGDEAAVPEGIALRVQFALDSAEIPSDGLRQLDVIAKGIAALAGTPRILIEGYTDASGSEQHNEVLSMRRAEAVRTSLIARGVAAEWLLTRGNGSSAPLRPDEPHAPENRRVELRRIS
jgi:outer membrane protein OmpA-like peptidoglycan-associated protein